MNDRAVKAMADPRRWLPGDIVIYERNNVVAVVHYRKLDNSGWELVGGGGLADYAVERGGWTWWGPAPKIGDEGVNAMVPA